MLFLTYSEGDYERIRVKFKTERSTGLLWYIGNEEKNINLGLQV